MSDLTRLASLTTVADCQALLEIEPLLVPTNADLVEILIRATQQPSTGLIGVVDPAGRLVGVIPVTRVAESIVARVVPVSLFIDVADSASAAQFSHSLEDRVAADIMLSPATTLASDTIGAAFRQMHQRRFGGLYVVDGAGVPTGYLDLLELALVYARALAAAPAPLDPGVASPPNRPTR
ncbi:MAG: hypothetical protein HW391_407 [Chloroflexi bacterium]|nr:hypothetical protein [Chloroflexota bacterium]